MANRFASPGVKAIALMGSFARGDAGTFSDVDIVCFLEHEPEQAAKPLSQIIQDRLVVVSSVAPQTVEEWFIDPVLATECVGGLRTARALWDPADYVGELKKRARAFEWNAALQQNANEYASRQLVGWVEEVHKGLAGLTMGDPGRMLNARFGLSWGLIGIMRVQRGVLISGDNGFYAEVIKAVGPKTRWARLAAEVFTVNEGGRAALSLHDQVRSGLKLYLLTTDLLRDALSPEDKEVIAHTRKLILEYLS